MGAPGGAYFCINGHLVDAWGHHEFSHFDELPKDQKICPHCGVSVGLIKCDHEWGDVDYDFSVPVDPILEEKRLSNRIITIQTDDGEIVSGRETITVKIYDVSKLFADSKNE